MPHPHLQCAIDRLAYACLLWAQTHYKHRHACKLSTLPKRKNNGVTWESNAIARRVKLYPTQTILYKTLAGVMLREWTWGELIRNAIWMNKVLEKLISLRRLSIRWKTCHTLDGYYIQQGGETVYDFINDIYYLHPSTDIQNAMSSDDIWHWKYIIQISFWGKTIMDTNDRVV